MGSVPEILHNSGYNLGNSQPMRTLLLLALLMIQRPVVEPEATGVVTGRLSTANGRVAGLRVAAMPAPEANAPGNPAPVLMSLSETDSEGRYRLEGLRDGRYLILAGLVESPTYYPGVRTVSQATVVTVADRATVTGIDFSAARVSIGLAIRGRAIHEVGGLPAVGTAISVFDGNQIQNATTRLDGSFEFVKLQPGNYMLNIAAIGLPPRTLVLVEDDVTDVEIVLPWTTAVSGTIQVEGGGPQPLIAVQLSGINGRNYTLRGSGDLRTIVPSGDYAVTVTELSSGYHLKSIRAGTTDLTTTPFRVLKESLPPAIEITLGVSDPPPWVRVSGRVTGGLRSSASGAPRAVGLSGPRNIETTVAADGSFEFEKVLPGSYALSLRPSNFTGAGLIVPNRDVTGLEVKLPFLKEVAGQIVVEDGGPLPRVRLTVHNAPSQSTVTAPATLNQLLLNVAAVTTASQYLSPDADGKFRVVLPEGQYRITADMQTFGSTAAPYVLRGFTLGTRVLLNELANVVPDDNSELRLTFGAASPISYARVSGRVLGSRTLDQAIAGAPLTVRLNSPYFTGGYTATVGSDGSFVFPKVPFDTYTATLSVSVAEIGSSPRTVSVSNRDVTDLEFVIPPQKDIAGRIVMESRAPMPHLALRITRPDGVRTVPLSPSANGIFRVTLLEDERPVTVEGLPPGYAVKSFTYGSVDLLRNPLKISATDNANLTITLSAPAFKTVNLKANITGLDGAVALTSLNAFLYPTESAFVSERLSPAVVADDGLEFRNLFPGKYRLVISGPGLVSPIETTVWVDDSNATINLAAPGQKQIRGRVVVDGQGPLPRLIFSQSPISSGATRISNLTIFPLPDGTFTLTLPEGETRVGPATRIPPGYTLKSFTYGSVDLLREPLKVSKSDTSELTITVMPPAVTPVSISGRVDGILPELTRGVTRVSLATTEYSIPPYETTVNADGTFLLANVFPGTYTGRLVLPGGTGLGPQGKTVTVERSDITDLQFDVPGQRIISGRMIIEGEALAPRILIRVMPADSRAFLSGRTFPVEPALGGAFRLTLPDGEYRVDVPVPPQGYSVKTFTYGATNLMTMPLRLAAGEATQEFALTLQVTAPLIRVRVSGRVTGLTALTRVVRVTLNGGPGVQMETPVDDEGRFAFSQIPPGTYGLRLNAVMGVTSPPPGRNITVGTSDVSGIEIAYPRRYLVPGRVLVNGAEAANLPPLVHMEVRRPNGQIVSSTMASGAFNLALDPEEQTIAVRTVADGYVLESVAYGSLDLLKSPLRLTAPPESDIVVRLASTRSSPSVRTVRLRGKVIGALDLVPASRELLVSGPGPSDLQTAILAKDGKFEVQSLRAGTYTLRVAGLPASLVAPREIVVADKDVKNVEIRIPVQVEVSGQVTVEGEQPLPPIAAMIVDVERPGGRFSAVVRENGSLSLVLQEGEQRVSARGVPAGYYVKSILYGKRDVTLTPIKLNRKDSPAGLHIILGVQRP